MIPVSYFIILSATLFAIGVFGALTRRNAVGILMSIEIMLNAASINFIAFGKIHGGATGQIFTLFVMGVAAAAAVVGLAILIVAYRNARTIYADKINILKW